LGFDRQDDKSVAFLNRIVELGTDAQGDYVTYEPDPRHSEILVKQLGLEGNVSKPVATPGVKSELVLDDRLLEGTQARLYRSVCMRVGFLAQDSPHLQYSAKEAARHMSSPTMGGWQRLKRLGRFLKGKPRCVQYFRRQRLVAKLIVKVDSDHAGCLETRKSSSSVYVFRGQHLLRSSSTTQTVQGLSTGESEFHAFVKACSIGLGAVAMARDMGEKLLLEIETDSSASKGIASRRGVGKIRHLHTPLLWVQAKVQHGDIKVKKISGKENCADMGTKHLGQSDVIRYLEECGFFFPEGQSKLALRAAV
jgi:hypothetical protein